MWGGGGDGGDGSGVLGDAAVATDLLSKSCRCCATEDPLRSDNVSSVHAGGHELFMLEMSMSS